MTLNTTLRMTENDLHKCLENDLAAVPSHLPDLSSWPMIARWCCTMSHTTTTPAAVTLSPPGGSYCSVDPIKQREWRHYKASAQLLRHQNVFAISTCFPLDPIFRLGDQSITFKVYTHKS